MAHLAHYKRSGAAPMLAHYERRAELERGYSRENIDASRTAENYAIGADSPQALAAALRSRVDAAIAAHEADSGKAIRRDANVLSDWVVTLPKDCPRQDARRFFEVAVDFCRERYGAENVLGGFVHMDEATPHAHIPIVPVRDGRLRAARVFTRSDLQRFHKDLGRAEDAALGRHVSVELDPAQQGEKQLSHLGQAEYVAAREEAARAAERAAAAESAQRAAEDRLECLQRGVEDAESLAAASLGEVRRVAREGGWAGGRERAARSRNQELRERAEALRGACDAARGRGDSLEAEKAGSPAAIQDLERGVRRLEGEHRELARRVRALRRERCELGGRVRELERRAEQLRGLLDRARGRLEGLAGRLAGLLTSAPDLARRLRPGSAELLRSWGMLPQAQERRRGRGMAR
ncbi:hypothetical protein AUL39_10700 [Tractidigestivibacter scatoligenes]|uniref:Plasmid recombination enzyme n=1 Tax=Tractidigestivibacter scatoligenes TaxID=1299998 RepID=A0A117J472_TRASO|nr:MobV family relaxase [Tractidigestivibacter scatoligenes]KUH57599.1 hypothetical protein AUL39_10700 [Tractidigestivibacter scatoligenes]